MEEDGEGYRRLRRFREVVVNESAKVGAFCPYLRAVGAIAFIIFPSTISNFIEGYNYLLSIGFTL
jgi:hypothetical protein